MAQVRFVARAIPGIGWRVWDRKLERWSGNPFASFPDTLLHELNEPKRPDELVRLGKISLRPAKNSRPTR